jgi:hypothetical protein
VASVAAATAFSLLLLLLEVEGAGKKVEEEEEGNRVEQEGNPIQSNNKSFKEVHVKERGERVFEMEKMGNVV